MNILWPAALLAILLLFSLIGCTDSAGAAAGGRPLYRDGGAAIDQRVQDLLNRMTLAEKVQQLRGVGAFADQITTDGRFDPAKAAPFLDHGIGQLGPIRLEASREVALRNAIQKYLMEQTRLGIPAMFHDEACHGFLAQGVTSFPVPIGLACSWNPDLMQRIFATVAGEMRARGVGHALAPVVDICRDPRWGRTDETLGEDPYLNGVMAAAIVRGLQGSDDGTVAPGHVAATLKHFAGHGQPQSGINRAPADVGLRDFYDSHLAAFRIAIALGHPAAVMPSYNEVDAVPSHANAWLLQDVLRKEFHFDGLIVSDYSGVEYLHDVHGVAADHADAAAKALLAGVDVDLPKGVAFAHLQELIEQGRVPMSAVDAAVTRVLRVKFKMGLFDNPYVDPQKAIEVTHKPQSAQLALEAARQCIVLLKNRDRVLPIPRDKYKTIAVIGPNAAQARLGSYSGVPWHKVSILQGMQQKLAGKADVLWAEGCKITTNLPDSSYDAWKKVVAPEFPTEAQNRASIVEAVAVARRADLIVLVLGENETLCREAWDGGHVGDRASLELPGAQNDLADAIFALGKPVVVYLMNGRPLAVPRAVQKADALLEGWYMGQETGTAVADVLLGDVNPSGKLTITIPRATGQIPAYYNCKPGARLFDYVDVSSQPLFPFGFGLSYTTFSYSAPVLSAPSMPAGGQVTVSTTVTNTGKLAGDEIVQLYIHQKLSSVTRPIKQLEGFSRISLAPGQARTVTFTINKDSLAFHDIHMNYTVEPGDFDVMVGPSSAELQKVTLRVTR